MAIQTFLLSPLKDVIRRLPGFTPAPSPSQYGWPSMEDIRLAVNTSPRTDPITGTTLLSKFNTGRPSLAKDQLLLASTDLKATGFTDGVIKQFAELITDPEEKEAFLTNLPRMCRDIVVALESGSGISASDPKSQFFFPLMVAAGVITQKEMISLVRDDTKKPFNVTITDETIIEAIRQIPIDDQFNIFTLSTSNAWKALSADIEQWQKDQLAGIENSKVIDDFGKTFVDNLK